MTTFNRNKQNEMRLQDKASTNQEKTSIDPVAREDQMLGEIELSIDPNDLPSEIMKNLENNLGPIDTENEREAKGLKKLQADEENENINDFQP
ncbi:hypothetical protein [Legionella drancourtii]|uniref:Uncharacterized protein n=1 Tax=Legionella drancourtii LLAP12 TaxID=658187 RepID=G9ENU3_9GAMM|nr:hypothetical protein [Legionella drancourtii]EHL31015.1 hypothetical protein LDG_6921 [Legionella drancourtii LLAP12]